MSWSNEDFDICEKHGLYNRNAHNHCPLCSQDMIKDALESSLPATTEKPSIARRDMLPTTEKLTMPISIKGQLVWYIRRNKQNEIFAYYYDEHWFSKLEIEFWIEWKRTSHVMPECQYKFDKLRKWAYDFAWPDLKIAVEMEGGVWIYGGHNRPNGYIDDLDKYNQGSRQGWCILRYIVVTQKTIGEVIATINDKGKRRDDKNL